MSAVGKHQSQQGKERIVKYACPNLEYIFICMIMSERNLSHHMLED